MNPSPILAEELRIMEMWAPHYRTSTLANSCEYQIERREFADWIVATVNAAGIEPRDAAVLDAGCGTGEVLQLLQERGFSSLVGLDLAPGMVAAAGRNLPDAQIVQGCIEDTYLPDRRIQVVTAAFTVHHLENPRSFFELVDRVLAPGGWFFLLEYNAASWSRHRIGRRLMRASARPLRVLFKLKNRRRLSALHKVPVLFNAAHRERTFQEFLDAMPNPKDYEVRQLTRGYWLSPFKHALIGESAFDRWFVRTVNAIERRALPAERGHFQWIAGRRRPF